MSAPGVFAAPAFDEELIRKYDTAGPRYTSYPTAPQFTEAFGPAEYERAVREAASAPDPAASLYFHLPFCRRVCYFCACNVVFSNDRARGWSYNDLLRKEMDLTLAMAGTAPLVRQLHWGGGTPTFNPPEVLDDLGRSIRERFPFADDAEVSVEVDPRETTPEHLEAMRRHGFNRVSMGIQDIDPDVQKAVNRIQPIEKTEGVVQAARRLGYTSVNVDLIYGLPRQTPASFAATLDRVLELAPDRVALFNFAYLPEMVRHQRVLKPEQLPRPADKLAILSSAVERFTEAGWVFIGMDHFARPDDELARAQADGTLYRNFQGYTTRAGLDLYGFGITAISQVGPTYSQNRKDFEAWSSAVQAGTPPTWRGIRLNDDDLLRRDIIFSLMCHFRLDMNDIGARHGVEFETRFAAELDSLRGMEADGLLRLRPGFLEVLPAGRLLVRNIAMTFDAYLGAPATRRFSRTV